MKKIIFSLVAVLVTLSIRAQEQRYIEVVAQEEMEVMPDEYRFTFRLREKTKYVNEIEPVEEEAVADTEVEEAAVEEIAEMPASDYKATPKKKYTPRKRIKISIDEQENAIRQYLKDQGVDAKNLISDNSSNTYSRNYTLTLKQPKNLKELLAGVDSIGASRVKLLSSKTNDKNKYRDEMALKALKHAKERAKKMAAIYNADLGDIISITEIPEEIHSDTNKIYDMIIAEIARKNRSDFTVITITYQVKVKFNLK